MTETSFIPGPETIRAFRDALGCFGTGVTVITTFSNKGPAAITANSFASVSLEPALVLWCLANASNRYETFANARHYAIHVMAEDQHELAQGFARDGLDFSHADWTIGLNGIPTLRRALARFDCRLAARHPAGDHQILVGEVLSATHRPGKGLMFKRGQYGGFTDLV
ncbi:flavin reductase family protein [Ruegeria marina]|nr:flavin reductase family protein [Ruegeria marina]